MSWRDFKKAVKRQFADFLEMPGDIVLDLPKITLLGGVQLYIENHRGIIEYTQQTVRVSTSEGEIIIAGEGLFLRNMLSDELCIEGRIRSISFAE